MGAQSTPVGADCIAYARRIELHQGRRRRNIAFWLSGQFGSLAATPSAGMVSLHRRFCRFYKNVGGNVAAAREITIGRFNPTAKVDLNLSLTARPDLVLVAQGYVFSTPVFGGQLAVSVGEAIGWSPVRPERKPDSDARPVNHDPSG